MSGQALDLHRSAQIMRRHKILIGVAAAVGLLAGAAYGFLNPPMFSSSALIVLPVSTRQISTEVVIAHSDPVLSAALPQAGTGISLGTLRTRVKTNSLTGNVISITAQGKTAAQAEAAANAVAASFISYVTSGNSAVGTLQAKLVAPVVFHVIA